MLRLVLRSRRILDLDITNIPQAIVGDRIAVVLRRLWPVLAGLAALAGPFVFVYLLALGLKRDQFVQYSSMFLVISATVMTAFLLGRGVMGWSDAVISTLATVPIFAGMWVGAGVRQYVSPELFKKLILIVIAVSGSQMLVGIH
jgi:uncharacterized membrane protein YfcA